MTEGTNAADPPKVVRLFTTPIKGFTLNEPDSITMDKNGAVGDRDFFIVDDKQELISITRTGKFASWRARFDRDESVLTLSSPDGQILEDQIVEGKSGVFDFWGSRKVSGHVVEGPWSRWLSEIVAQPVSLIRATQPGDAFDEAAVTLVSEESIAELGRVTGSDAIDVRRFRMLINICGVDPYGEEAWRPSEVRIGSVVLRMGGPVPRCNATTRNPDTGRKDLKTLRLIEEARGMQPSDSGDGLNLGAYADVISPGVISVGDLVEHN